MTEWDDGLCPVRFSMRGGGLKRRKLAVKGGHSAEKRRFAGIWREKSAGGDTRWLI